MAKNSELTVAQCWTILGKDPSCVISTLKKAGETDEEIVQAAEKAFSNAKKIAKKLQAKFHPDKNPNDPKALEKFKRVSLAIKCLEEHTTRLREKYEIMKNRVYSSNKEVIYFKDN